MTDRILTSCGFTNFTLVITRPDITYIACKVAQFMVSLQVQHLNAMERYFCYLLQILAHEVRLIYVNYKKLNGY